MKQYIKSLGLDWAFRYYIKDQENLIKFFNTFYELETDDNLLSFVKEFRKLPEFNWELRPFESISQESSDYFTALDQFARENPLKALKLVILLCCHEENFYDNHVFITKLKSTAQGFFFLDNIPLLVRLKFCIHCVHNWPIDDPREYRSGCFFSGILSVLFIQYATENSQKALLLFEKEFPKNNTHFLSSSENHFYFLKFISNYIEERPQQYIETLCECLSDTHCYDETAKNIRTISQKLFSVINDPKYTSILYKDNYKLLKRIFTLLLKNAYPDELWFPEIADRFWKIEAKAENTEYTYAPFFSHCYVIAINAPDSFACIDALCQKYKNTIVSLYNAFSDDKEQFLEVGDWFCDDNQFERLVYEMLDLINCSLYREYHFYRNYYIKATDISIVGKQLIEHTVNIYWEMVEWLKQNNFVAFFYVLKVGIQNNHPERRIINEVAIQAEALFFKYLEKLIKNYPEESIHFIGKIIGDSIYYGKCLFPFLDRLLPIVIQINPNIAKAAVQEGINYQQHDREYIWHPHDLHTNPVYQGVREPEIWNL